MKKLVAVLVSLVFLLTILTGCSNSKIDTFNKFIANANKINKESKKNDSKLLKLYSEMNSATSDKNAASKGLEVIKKTDVLIATKASLMEEALGEIRKAKDVNASSELNVYTGMLERAWQTELDAIKVLKQGNKLAKDVFGQLKKMKLPEEGKIDEMTNTYNKAGSMEDKARKLEADATAYFNANVNK